MNWQQRMNPAFSWEDVQIIFWEITVIVFTALSMHIRRTESAVL